MLTVTAVQNGIASATAALVSALETQTALQTAVANAKEFLAVRKGEILVANAADPKALGSNEATREATIASMCADEVNAVKQAEFALLCHGEKTSQ